MDCSLRDRRVYSYLEEAAVLTPGDLEMKVVRDPDDDKFLSAALEGSATYIVSGDNDLHSIKSYKGIKIVGAREFLTILETLH